MLLRSGPLAPGPGRTEGAVAGEAGEDLIVKVTCQKTWSALGALLPSLENPTLTS